MSRRAFDRDFDDELFAIKAPKFGDFERVERRVIDRWMADGRHDDLVRYMAGAYGDTEGGDFIVSLVANDLVRIERPDLIRKLYGATLHHRCEYYFARRELLEFDRLIPKRIANFLERISPLWRELARYKVKVLALMEEYRVVLAKTSETDFSEIDRMIAAFQLDKKLKKRPVSLSTRKMTEKAFWGLIAEARAAQESDREIVATIETSLANLDPVEIEKFQKLLQRFLDRSYRWDLWAVVYAECGGCGDDGFDYFRGWLILQGKDVYKAAITDPVGWVTDPAFKGTSQCEELSHAAPNAYRSKVGQEMPQIKSKPMTDPIGEPWEEDELAARFPALAERFDL